MGGEIGWEVLVQLKGSRQWDSTERVVLRKGEEKVVKFLWREGLGVEVVPFRHSEKMWSVEWK